MHLYRIICRDNTASFKPIPKHQNCETTIDLIKVCLLRLELSYSLTGEFCELLRVELGHLGGESHLSEHSLHVGLVDQGGEPTVHVLEGLPKQFNSHC